MEQLYHISLHAVETQMKKQFAEPDERERQRAGDRPERVSVGSRLRLRVSNALYALATALDPAHEPSRAPSHQH